MVNLGDYVGLESDDQIISALKLGFIDAQMLCAKLGMKPAKVIMKSWWKLPWVHERKLEKELFSSMEEEKCDFVHIHDATAKEGGICGNGQAITGASSSSTEAERGEVSQLINDQVEVAGLESELRHVLVDVLDEHEGCQVVSNSVLPYVEFEGAKIYKSTLVSQLNGNLTLSKDRLTRIKSGIIYTEEKVKTLANRDTLLKLGCACSVVFFNTPEVQTVKKRGRPRLSAPTKMWFLGRVYRMRRKIINRWVEYRNPVDLLDRPNNVEVGLYWYQKSAELKWSYDLTNHTMVELDTVIVLANLRYDAKANTYKLHPSDEKVFNDFITKNP